jgi:hypothetical protein
MRSRVCYYASLSIATAVVAGCPTLDDGSGSAGAASGGSAGSTSQQMTGPCTPLDGNYRFRYTLRSGTCGALTDELQQFSNGRSIPSPALNCQAGGDTMNACQLQRDQLCAVTDPDSGLLVGHTHVTGVLSASTNSTQVSGTLDVEVLGTNGSSCEGTYDVTGTKL